MKITSAVVTDVGNYRQNNEDNFYLCGRYKEDVDTESSSYAFEGSRERFLFSVCDGMGGESFGELASLIAVRLLDSYADDFSNNAQQYAEKANGEICAEITAHGGKRIGTTFAVLELTDGFAHAFNIGDSRIYHIRKGAIRQLSKDHSQIQMLIDQGFVSAEAARSHPGRHVLTQHLGIFPEEMLVETYAAEPVAVENGDIFLLCSDGLTDALSDGDILRNLHSGITTEQRVSNLVRAALKNGSRDNITVLLAEIEDAEKPAPKKIAPKKPHVDCDTAKQILQAHSKTQNSELIEEIMSIIKSRTDLQRTEE